MNELEKQRLIDSPVPEFLHCLATGLEEPPMFLRRAAGQVLPVVVHRSQQASAFLVFLIPISRMKHLAEMWLRCGDKMLPLLRQNSSILLSIIANQVSVSTANLS